MQEARKAVMQFIIIDARVHEECRMSSKIYENERAIRELREEVEKLKEKIEELEKRCSDLECLL